MRSLPSNLVQYQHATRAKLAEVANEIDMYSTSIPPVAERVAELWRSSVVALELDRLIDTTRTSRRSEDAYRRLVVVFEECGRALVPLPVLGTLGLSLPILFEVADSSVAALIDRAVTGDATIAFVDGTRGTHSPSVTAVESDRSWAVTGSVSGVVDAAVATDLLILADTHHGATLVHVRADAPGVNVAERDSLDRSRQESVVQFVSASGSLVGAVGSGADVVCRARMRSAVLLAAEQVGGSQACLDAAVQHARTRVQFGRSIGSFQAIKHKCVEMLRIVETARAGVYAASSLCDSDDPELALGSAAVGAFCSTGYVAVSEDTIHIHGGSGFVWEHLAHRHFRRAKVSEHLLGGPRSHRESIADILLADH